MRRLDVPLAELESTLVAVVDGALADCSVTLPRPDELVEPDPLRRADGASVYVVAGSQLFSSRAVLAAEQSLLRAAGQFDGRRISTAAIEMALLEATANGLVLNEGQVAFVRDLAGSGARCQLARAGRYR